MKKVKHPRTCPDYVISTCIITHMLQRCVYRCWKHEFVRFICYTLCACTT